MVVNDGLQSPKTFVSRFVNHDLETGSQLQSPRTQSRDRIQYKDKSSEPNDSPGKSGEPYEEIIQAKFRWAMRHELRPTVNASEARGFEQGHLAIWAEA